MDLQQNRVWSEQSIYPSPAKFNTSPARNILKVCESCTLDFLNQPLMKKPKKIARGDIFVVPKFKIRLKLKLSSLFNTLIRNPLIVSNVPI